MSFVVPHLPFDAPGPVFAVLLLVVLVAPLLASAVRVPDIVMLLLAGMLVGPAGIGLLERDGAVALLGGAGLLYLMFLAGLELDLDDFRATRSASLRFGALTFVVPLLLGTGTALALGFAPLPAVLLGSCWSSHTLLTYPQFRSAGTAGHPTVATAVGATIITDTAALLVLAVVVRAHTGSLGPAFWLTLVPSVVLLFAGTLWLPRVARRFFAGPGQDPLLRLLFVLVSLFTVAGLTELVGIEPIVGAFVAGLALNRSVPNGGALMERVELLGGSLFVPLFLVATGMLVDVRLLLEPRVLLWGAVFVASAVVGKLLVSIAAGRLLRATTTEMATMFALSNAQAAATLAAVVVGREVGMFVDGVVDAVVLVVLVTCLVASLVAARVAPRLPPDTRTRPLGSSVVVPVVNPDSAGGLLGLAAAFARSDGGVVVPVVVLVLGWKGHGTGRSARLGGAVDLVLDAAQVPTLVLHDGQSRTARVLVVLDGSLVRGRGRAAVALGLRVAAEAARQRRIPVEVVTTFEDPAVSVLVAAVLDQRPVLQAGSREAVLARSARPDDLVVLPTLADRASLRRLATRVLRVVPPGASTLLAVARGARAAGAERGSRAAPDPLVAPSGRRR